ncbi:MAG: hypothetical protein EOO40_03245 [Deltaproteobacteria bacterium]|nr:MAG: hypothetical protein EOO40_03245 [Deltaproteobacteria bacterium]
MGISANGTNVMSLQKGQVNVAGVVVATDNIVAPGYTFPKSYGATSINLTSPSTANEAININMSGIAVGIFNATGVRFTRAASFDATISSNTSTTASVAASTGTAAVPSYAFTSNLDTGMYLAAASTTAAVGSLTANATDVLKWQKGSVAITGNASATKFTAASSNNNGGFYFANNANNFIQSFTQAGTPTDFLSFNVNNLALFSIGSSTSYSTASVTSNAPLAVSASKYGAGVNMLSITNGTGTFGVDTSGTTTTSALSVLNATTAAGTVTSTTAAGTASFVSTQGFKSNIDGGNLSFGATAAPSSSFTPFTRAVILNGGTTVSQLGKSYVAPFAGSVVGFSVYIDQPLTVATYISMIVNGRQTGTLTIAANATTGYLTFTKGSFPVPVGGYAYMQAYFASASTGNAARLSGDFIYEMGA